jgi:hypothetical protein
MGKTCKKQRMRYYEDFKKGIDCGLKIGKIRILESFSARRSY